MTRPVRLAPDPGLRFAARFFVDRWSAETAGLGADSPCWTWTHRRDRYGYAVMSIAGQWVKMHRWAFVRIRGAIPPGTVLDHRCRNRACVNPYHLDAVSNRENTLRGAGPTAQNAKKKRCDKGHALTGTNLRIEDGRRRCRACSAAKSRAHRARKRGTS